MGYDYSDRAYNPTYFKWRLNARLSVAEGYVHLHASHIFAFELRRVFVHEKHAFGRPSNSKLH